MHCPRTLLLAAALLTGCADATLDPTHRASEPRLARYDAVQYEVHELATFAGQPTQGMEIDKHGTVYGRYGTGVAQRSYRWTESGGFEDLGAVGISAFQLLGVNDHGLMNGSILTDSGQRAAVRLSRGGFVLIDPDFPGNTLGNNDRGEVAGTRFVTQRVSHAFVWSEGAGLSLLPVSVEGAVVVSSSAADVNERRVVAGQLTFNVDGVNQSRPFLWHEVEGTTLLPSPGPSEFGVTHVTDEGLVIGAAWTRRPMLGDFRRTPIASNPGTIPSRAWKWSAEGGLVDLGTLGGDHSVAWNADREGNVYGWASDADGVKHAVKWLATGGIIDLGPNTLTGGLNKHGVVVGWSTPADGVSHPLVFIPVKK